MNKVLFFCYYFPPMGMGGTQRATKFVKYLPTFNWEPIVVTVKNVKYYAQDFTLLDEISHSKIIRTESLDPLRLFFRFASSGDKSGSQKQTNGSFSILHFLNKIFVNWFLIPDSKILWLPFSLVISLKLIRQYKIRVIFTTSPPHSAHLGGLILKWITGVKWVADFRDDWTGGESQPNPTIFHLFLNKFFEKLVLKFADRVIAMCSPLTGNLRRKGGDFQSDKFLTISNGYDPEDFFELVKQTRYSKFTITHAGSISKVSDPESFLKAIQILFDQNPHLRDHIQIQFFGTDIFGNLEHLIKKYNLSNNILPIKYLPHQEVLGEVMRSHLLLLVINKRTKEEIITSKVFEYLGSGKPILLISGEGEVARLIRKYKRGNVVNNNNIEEIKEILLNYYNLYKQGNLTFSKPVSIRKFDRKFLTKHLAEVFSELTKI
jgi:glycosyltransferase involved in cell wall biosynthesis